MIFKNLNEPKEENVDQVQLYLHYFKIPKGILLYVDKDKLELKEFLVNYDKNRAEDLLKKLSDIKNKIDKNIIPSRIPGYPDDWQCGFCSFRGICDIANGGEVNWVDFKKKVGLREKGQGAAQIPLA